MSLNYPLNPDTSFESFVLTKESDVIATFGTTYSQNELSPMNYNKVMLACIAGTLTYAPIREFTYISDAQPFGKINDEVTFNTQSINLFSALIAAYNYWKTDILLIPSFQCPLGIVTEITQTTQQDGTGAGLFHLVTTLKINWLVISSKSQYA